MIHIVLISALLSVLPISELRGAIPYAFFNGIGIFQAFAIGVIFNTLVPPICFLFLGTIHKYLDRNKQYHKLFERTILRARNKVSAKIEKYGMWGLLVFVAIPLPITGAWTGSIGAWVLNLNKKKSVLAIACGVVISGIIVSAILYAGIGINSIFVKKI